MSIYKDKYLELEALVKKARENNCTEQEEDDLLDQSQNIWNMLSKKERDELYKEAALKNAEK